MTKLEELIAERNRVYTQLLVIQDRLEKAENAVLEERFVGVDRYQQGDIVLVPRKLFGQIKQWPAKIAQVRLHYSEGTYKDDDRYEWSGQQWSHQYITYTVFLQQKDGTFGGTSAGFDHDKVQPMPAQEDTNA
jgi:hypothetical protein